MKLGGNSEDMRKKNRCTVLQILLRNDSISRADLARQTGLNKATITNIINDFTQIGIVRDAGSVIASNGRKTAGIRLDMLDVVTLVIRINRYEISFAFCNIHGDISDLRKENFANDDGIDTILELLRKNTQYLLDNRKEKKVMGISIAILGWLFRYDGHIIAKTDGFPELSKVDFREKMSKMFPDYHIMLDHDANLSALTEWNAYTKNSETAAGSMLSIIGGIGFGAGIIINGELFHGSNGVAGEVGHMGINFNAVNYSPNSSSQYRGTFEEYASPRALQNNILDRLMDFPETSLNDKSGLDDIYEAYEQEDELAVWAMNRMSRLLAYGLTGLIFIINPEVIVLGDRIIHSERFLAKLRYHLQEFLPSVLYDRLDLRISEFNESGILIGASIAMTKYYLETFKIIDFII
ncbi:putative NBD/HSP70 family sugar kinase [Anaerobacterium chartisolvens]|uniref:Putative NBD/HSP70 family sugar kinase n=1 Tax=Anaerobacterium chartisolvens TaxID=1297424 RepID=A0A369B6E7_9FIRM|nr:ROK family transcriptional regulator [Anaerobacterium chartisolvens]RCX16107.1 putative NBD/HSP70 family sugar kinase [Anaerobacterium chartisolvens]